MIYRTVVLALIVEMIADGIVRAIVVVLYALALLMADWRVQPFANRAVQRLESLMLALLTVQAVLQIRGAALQNAAAQSASPVLDAFIFWATWSIVFVPLVVLGTSFVGLRLGWWHN